MIGHQVTQIGLAVVATAALIMAVVFWRRNSPSWVAIRAALRGQNVKVPDKTLSWYDAGDLARFIRAARKRPIGGGASALDLWREPGKRANDTRFAMAIATAFAFGALAIGPFVPLQPYGARLAFICALMAAAYGLCDILEDVVLDRIVLAGRPVSRALAFIASFLTRAKFVALYFALPAVVGAAGWAVYHYCYGCFYGVLKALPIVVLLIACIWTPLARVLWACRISLLSALAGYFLFPFVIQAQDLFADTTFADESPLHVAFWTGVFAAVALIWALPVHYAARDALEGANAAWYVQHGVPAWLRVWAPRVLGAVPVIAVLLGIFGAAVETRGAMRIESGLPLQFVLLALGGWFTLGFVLLLTIDRRRFVRRYLRGPDSIWSQRVVIVCALTTSVLFAFLFFAPLYSTRFVDRAALVPFLLGSGVLLFGALSRFADRMRMPVVGFVIVGMAVLTALNWRFNQVRQIEGTEHHPPLQAALEDAVTVWRAANHCPVVVDDAVADEKQRRRCPPVLIIASDGGASRAAYFTATAVGKILDQLSDSAANSVCGDRNNPARCIFAFSGVSGGSLGLAAVKAAILDTRDKKWPCKSVEPGKWQECFANLVSGDYLSPAFVGLVFRDQFAPPVWPFTDPDHWGNRAALLEYAWESSYLEQGRGKPEGLDPPWSCGVDDDVGLCRPLAEKKPDGFWAPLLLLNGTSVGTGRRVIASEIGPVWQKPDEHKLVALHQWAYDLFDILGATCRAKTEGSETCASEAAGNPSPQVNVRLSTAALLSARFPIISPAGSIWMQGESGKHGDEVVDGGYFENSGVTTALDIAAALHKLGLTPIVASISNDPSPEVADSPSGNSTPPGAVAPECNNASGWMHLCVGKADDSPWIRSIDVVNAPFAALFHTRDGHADEAGKTLAEGLFQWNPTNRDAGASFFPIRVYRRGQYGKIPFTMPELSMSWWLSPVVRKALDAQLDNKLNVEQFRQLKERLSHFDCSDCETVQKSADLVQTGDR